MKTKQLVIVGGRAIDPSVALDEPRDLLLEDGEIKAVDKPGSFTGFKDAEKIDARGKYVVPGLVDIHVHFREPGFEWKEDVASGSRAAVAGGFTAVCCMPNTDPVNDNESVTKMIREKAEQAGGCRVYPFGAITKGQQGKELAPLVELWEAGCVAFSDDGKPVVSALMMRRALEYARVVGAVCAVHEEDPTLAHGFAMHEGVHSLRLGLVGMPGAAEDVMIARDIELAKLTSSPLHFCHVSTARAVTLIRRAKEDGIPVTAEAAPHHITLTDETVGNFDTRAKVNPPLRRPEDIEALLAGLEQGVIDCIASDHAPHEWDAKNREFALAPNGLIGLQSTVPLVLAKVRAGKLSLRRAIEAMTSAPARCLRLKPVALRKGSVADVTVIDPERKVRLTSSYILSKSKNTPLLDRELQGVAVVTIVGGETRFVMERE